ncbi:hypothetical protein VV38_10965 [Clavibacter nebraskensis]|nr:hypothetical protein VV38_10965 [Clavibacter nebraskensis]OAH19570.1 hypothetical protein A3Q38_08490 [Clavibacter nebraskensis]
MGSARAGRGGSHGRDGQARARREERERRDEQQEAEVGTVRVHDDPGDAQRPGRWTTERRDPAATGDDTAESGMMGR